MIYTHRTMILPASVVDSCQRLSVRLSGEAGAGMWTTGLSATGEAPATHFISSGMIGKEFIDILNDPTAMLEASQEEGSEITLEQCECLLSVADVSEEGPFEAMERLGLKMVITPETTKLTN